MKQATLMGLPIRRNQRPTAKWCKTCGRKHSRRVNCLLVEQEVKLPNGNIVTRYKDIDDARPGTF